MKTDLKLLSGYAFLMVALSTPAFASMGGTITAGMMHGESLGSGDAGSAARSGHSHASDSTSHEEHGPTMDEKTADPGMHDELMQRIMADHGMRRELMNQIIGHREFMDHMIDQMMQKESARDLIVERVMQNQKMRSRILQRAPQARTRKPLNPKTIGRGRRFQ